MNAITTLHARRAVSIRPISAAGFRLFDTDRRATHATVTANYLYVTRQAGHDEVFSRLGLPVGSYASFAVRVENLMLPLALAALDEYGLPLQLVARLETLPPGASDLDSVIAVLRRLDATRLQLSAFERGLLDEVKATL